MATDDTSEYLDNTDEQVEMLLVTNFDELESGLNKILDESGPILKRNLAQVTQAVAIDNLADIVSGLGNVKRHLRDIHDQTIFVQDKVSQLKLGLSESKNRLIGSSSYQFLFMLELVYPLSNSDFTLFYFDKFLLGIWP